MNPSICGTGRCRIYYLTKHSSSCGTLSCARVLSQQQDIQTTLSFDECAGQIGCRLTSRGMVPNSIARLNRRGFGCIEEVAYKDAWSVQTTQHWTKIQIPGLEVEPL